MRVADKRVRRCHVSITKETLESLRVVWMGPNFGRGLTIQLQFPNGDAPFQYELQGHDEVRA